MLTTMKAPGEELIDILGKTGELKEAEGAICGNLTEEGAKERLAFGRGRRGGGADAPPGPKNAKGSIKVWTKDGMVCKYELTVSGTITVGQDQTERDINRTSTVEIKEVGKTKVTVPDEAKKKLGA
jgi:hypothetical protein